MQKVTKEHEQQCDCVSRYTRWYEIIGTAETKGRCIKKREVSHQIIPIDEREKEIYMDRGVILAKYMDLNVQCNVHAWERKRVSDGQKERGTEKGRERDPQPKIQMWK